MKKLNQNLGYAAALLFAVGMISLFIGCAKANKTTADSSAHASTSAQNSDAIPTDAETLPAGAKAEQGSTQNQPVNLVIVMDSSGSMAQRIGGKSKMEIAKEVLNRVAGEVPDNFNVGLRAYGHREKNNCRDTELLVPIATMQQDTFRVLVSHLRPLGQTPISYALSQAADDLKARKGKKVIILISDGEETCGGDPCAVAENFKRAGIELHIHVVGFNIDTPAAKQQLSCIAEKTGGTYLDARDSGQLLAGMQNVVEASTQINLIKNGSFEQGTDPGGYTALGPASKDILAWTITKGTIDYIGGYWHAPDGSRSIDLDGTPGPGGIAQSFHTVAGQRYRVTFLLSGNDVGGPQVKRMQVKAANQSAIFEFDVSKNQPKMVWMKTTWEFTANSDRTTIEFESLDPPGNYGPVLDNVSVVAISKAPQ